MAAAAGPGGKSAPVLESCIFSTEENVVARVLPLAQLSDFSEGRLRAALEQAGLGPGDNCNAKVELYIAAATVLQQQARNQGFDGSGGTAQAAAFWVPGRVEVICIRTCIQWRSKRL